VELSEETSGLIVGDAFKIKMGRIFDDIERRGSSTMFPWSHSEPTTGDKAVGRIRNDERIGFVMNKGDST
jgi:hypothetical protein